LNPRRVGLGGEVCGVPRIDPSVKQINCAVIFPNQFKQFRVMRWNALFTALKSKGSENCRFDDCDFFIHFVVLFFLFFVSGVVPSIWDDFLIVFVFCKELFSTFFRRGIEPRLDWLFQLFK
jgi:hypothetical protein